MDQLDESIVVLNQDPPDYNNEKNQINETTTSDLATSVRSDISWCQVILKH